MILTIQFMNEVTTLCMINRWSESNIPNIGNAKNIKNKTKQRNYFRTASRQTTVEIDLWGLISKKKQEEQEQYYVIC